MNEFNGRIIKAGFKEISLPNGKNIKIDLVNHPGGASILPIDNDGNVILLKQFRGTIEDYIWEIPAGKLEGNENPLERAKKELEEEAGFRAETWKKIISFYTTPGFCDELLHIYIASNLIKTKSNPEPHEVIEVHSFNRSQIQKMINNKEIVDSKTLIALLMWLNNSV